MTEELLANELIDALCTQLEEALYALTWHLKLTGKRYRECQALIKQCEKYRKPKC